MISHRRRFIFVHIGKAGGKSVRKALRPIAFSPVQRAVEYIDARTFKFDFFGADPAGSHPSVAELKAAIGKDVFENYFSFSFVRNPWSRMVSLHRFIQLRPKSVHYKAATRLNFADFVDALDGSNPFLTQSSLLLDANGAPQVDFIGRFETLNDDFEKVCKTIGCKASLPHKNKTSGGSFRTEYKAETVDKVKDMFADDVANFGYRFEA